MAEDSLYDLSSFLNRWFWRNRIPVEKNSNLHILCADWCCLGGFGRSSLSMESRSAGLADRRRADLGWAISVMRQRDMTEDPRDHACWRVAFFCHATLRGKCHEITLASRCC